MASNKSGRILVAAALAAVLFLPAPAAAIGGREAPSGLLERLTTWLVSAWTWEGDAGEDTDDDAGTDPAQNNSTLPTDDEDPQGCRDYTACIDPNG